MTPKATCSNPFSHPNRTLGGSLHSPGGGPGVTDPSGSKHPLPPCPPGMTFCMACDFAGLRQAMIRNPKRPTGCPPRLSANVGIAPWRRCPERRTRQQSDASCQVASSGFKWLGGCICFRPSIIAVSNTGNQRLPPLDAPSIRTG